MPDTMHCVIKARGEMAITEATSGIFVQQELHKRNRSTEKDIPYFIPYIDRCKTEIMIA